MAKLTRSPRAPSFSLEESLSHVMKLYEGNGKHAIPADVAAKTLGYSGANNGSAARAFASMRSFGLLTSNNKGDVAVSPDVEAYRYAPDEAHRQNLKVHWLTSPKIYRELLEEYHDRLPSDQVIRYKLIKMGFAPSTAEDCLKVFQQSVNFVDYYGKQSQSSEQDIASDEELWGSVEQSVSPPAATSAPSIQLSTNPSASTRAQVTLTAYEPPPGIDRIPVRLSKGRRAWIEVPSPLYEADKAILKNQIDLIFTDEDEA